MFKLEDKLKGITLIEMLLVIVVTLIIAIPLILLFTQALRGQALAQIMETNILLAQAKIEEVLGKDFYNVKKDTYNCVFNSLGGYSGVTGEFSNYQYRVCVDYINPNLADLGESAILTPAGARSNYIFVKVEVYNIGFPNKIVTLRTIITPSGNARYYRHQ